MINKIITVFECSRIYTLPMSIMSWLVVFTFSSMSAGNKILGILALLGICFAHLGTNVLDDYFDYKSLIKQVDFDKTEYLKNTQKTKCRCIISGMTSPQEVLKIAFVYLGLALIIGIILYLKCGKGVLYFALAGGIIAGTYSFLSRIRLAELAVALAYGPVLFGGVYYVMTKTYSSDVILLSLPTMFMTVVLLYIHSVMDYDFDISEGKSTVANSFDSRLDSLAVLKGLLICAYLSPILLCVFDIVDWQAALVYFTIPLAADLFCSMKDYSINTNSVPEKRWFHFPMENMDAIKKIDARAFMIRMYQSRNLMMYFSILMTIAIILGFAA